ncbi:hypothetical protein P167DRAFT_566040 [Morchella conica CCBAS932]|uniref:Uncharacterized protein n=1 Tax=Morchella conica CCBAS932 TaxID=1392247 RepID=A0A3N4KKW0_9PEZI|nr:hypothetical protein P167DRAFT_566040 [Morchella conica CCBAS932]
MYTGRYSNTGKGYFIGTLHNVFRAKGTVAWIVGVGSYGGALNLQYKYRVSPFMPTSRSFQQDVEYPTGSRPALVPSHTPSPVRMPHLGAGYMENSPQEQKPSHMPSQEKNPRLISPGSPPLQDSNLRPRPPSENFLIGRTTLKS